MKARYTASKFLNDGLMNCLFFVSKDEGIAMRRLLGKRHLSLKLSECFVYPAKRFIIESIHR